MTTERLRYLTVQDILWLNLQVTKKVQHFNYARLEEAAFYQYAYGENVGAVPQACRFFNGFLRMHPFDSGNAGSAFAASAAFLRLNDRRLILSDEEASAWLEASAGQTIDCAAFAERSEVCDGHELRVQEAISLSLAEYPATIQELLSK